MVRKGRIGYLGDIYNFGERAADVDCKAGCVSEIAEDVLREYSPIPVGVDLIGNIDTFGVVRGVRHCPSNAHKSLDVCEYHVAP